MSPPKPAFTHFDGRWLCVILVAVYALWLTGAGSGADRTARWKQAGVMADDTMFMDLYVFPAARTTLAAGGDPYVTNPADPWQRTYNYPKAWLLFMRFPGEPQSVNAIGIALVIAAFGLWLLYLGRLSPLHGLVAGLFTVSPAIMLGVNRGNTDLAIFGLIVAGILGYSEMISTRRWGAQALWLVASLLKLYPILIFTLWVGTSWRLFLRRSALPLLLFAVYSALRWHEILATLKNTAAGWVLSYGSRVAAKAINQVLSYYQLMTVDEIRLGQAFALLAVSMVVVAVRFGMRWRARTVESAPEFSRFRLGFLVGGVIYVSTFLAGNSFSYRLIFALLMIPWLWNNRKVGGPIGNAASLALLAMFPALWLNFFNGGWPGFILDQLAGWCLCALVAALLPTVWLAPVGPNTSRLTEPALAAL